MNHHIFVGDESERRKWQDPEAILVDVGLKRGFTFVDVGCGSGFFALPAARLVGEKGMIYGLDSNDEAIRRLKEKARRENLRNLSLHEGAGEENVLCEGCADIVFLGIVLHDFNDPSRVLINARRMLKPTGLLVDLDWKKEPMELGPPAQIRFSEKEATSLMENVGYAIETVKEVGLYNYIITAKPLASL